MSYPLDQIPLDQIPLDQIPLDQIPLDQILRGILRDQAGLDVVQVKPTAGGESRHAFWVTERSGSATLLKILPGAAPEDAARLHTLQAVIARLRDRGYPAPRIRTVGQVPGLVFWLQEPLPGHPLEDTPARVPHLLPDLLRLNDAQAGLATRPPQAVPSEAGPPQAGPPQAGPPQAGPPQAGPPQAGPPQAGPPQAAPATGPPTWPDLLVTTLTAGGDGYCLHETLAARPDTRDLLAVIRQTGEFSGPHIPPGDDFVHYDFTLANVLTGGAARPAVTGVIDVNPPLLAGDRAFDLATLLYYLYDRDDLRDVLRARLLDQAGPRAAAAYLAHMVLRQVEWSLRHHPDAQSTQHHLDLGRLVIADISPAGEYRSQPG